LRRHPTRRKTREHLCEPAGERVRHPGKSLGAALVVRGPDGLKLTALGESIVPFVERVEQTVVAIRELAANRSVRVRLALPSGLTGLFTPHVAALQRAHPKLALELVSGARPANLKAGEADLAIRIAPITDKDLVARKLGDSGSALYASDAYLARRGAPHDLDDLRDHDVVGYDKSFSGVPAGVWLEARSKHANVVMRSREITDMLAAAIAGVGLAVLPCVVGDLEPRLRRLTAVIASRTVSLVYRREAKLSRELHGVIRFVVDVMRANAKQIAGA